VINEIEQKTKARMEKSLDALQGAFAKIRTGRAHPGILDGLTVDYYGTPTPLNQVAGISVEDARTLTVKPWEKNLLPDIEKVILKSDLGLNPTTSGDTIRLPLPSLTEETRRNLTKQARAEAENARIAIRNIRRDANSATKELIKDKVLNEDDERKAHERIQKMTDNFIALVEKALTAKETDLMAI
jgi:ribosome recycling factor